MPAPAAGGTGTFPAGITYAEVVSALDRANCPWAPYPPPTFGTQCSLVALPSRANFTFEVLEGGEPVLNVMGLPPDGHDCCTRTADRAP
ncbi:hypothetical protein [Streptomyces sp. NPDC029674]|uniref:hypothetical protein n=1 Tax=Streptomyces sp. NPDC029674 TaxID=3365297 RepID=UPI00384C9853